MSINSVDFLNTLERIFVRHSLSKSMSSHAPLREIIANGKNKKREQETEGSFRSQFSSSENIIDSKRFQLITDAFNAIKAPFEKKYPGFAIIILGSNAHGGAKIRAEMDNFVSPEKNSDDLPSDVDYFFLTDKGEDLDYQDVINFEDVFGKALRKLARQRQYPDWRKIRTCDFYHQSVARNIAEDPQSFYLSLLKERYIRLRAYLYPSIPKERNESNREVLLQALSKLSIDSHEDWEEIVSVLINAFIENKTLQQKHFGSRLHSQRDRQLVSSVAPEISEKSPLSEKMIELLRSTDISK